VKRHLAGCIRGTGSAANSSKFLPNLRYIVTPSGLPRILGFGFSLSRTLQCPKGIASGGFEMASKKKHPASDHHNKAAADHEAAAHHHRQASHHHDHGRHDEAKEHAGSAHEHSQDADRHSKTAHEASHK
jgi:hypothetical protein